MMNAYLEKMIHPLVALTFLAANAYPATYYLDADGGNDGNAGTATNSAWATLAKANAVTFSAGDQILLQCGDTFAGKLVLGNESGTAGNVITVASYGSGDKPVIDASGYEAGVRIQNVQYVEVRDLEITADGGVTVDGSATDLRHGVYVSGSTASHGHITLRNLTIHDIYPETDTVWPETWFYGVSSNYYAGEGIRIQGGATWLDDVLIEDCHVERTGFKGLDIKQASNIQILNTTLKDVGGPGIVPVNTSDLIVRGCTVDSSGAYLDPRMSGRGSGMWPNKSDRVLVEHNRFMHARGRNDSCGIHIDHYCTDVTIQYNLSLDNEGGFIKIFCKEALRNVYRYNISINDGQRVAHNDGVAWVNDGKTMEFVDGTDDVGNPYTLTNTYIYNNTIYTKADYTSRYSLTPKLDGVLMANNIFYIEGPTANVYTKGGTETPTDILFENNLYIRANLLPATLAISDAGPMVGDPLFANPGGLAPEDYIPGATNVVRDQGIAFANAPGDGVGPYTGHPTVDYFGNPIIGLPDFGAVEIGGVLPSPWIRIDLVEVVGTNVVLGCTNGPASSWFALQSKTNLMDAAWTTVQTDLPIDATGAGSVTNPITLHQEFYRLFESDPPPAGLLVIEFTTPDYSNGTLNGQQNWNAEAGWSVGDSAGAGYAATAVNTDAAVWNEPVQLDVGETYSLSINLQFGGGPYATPTGFVYAFLGGLKPGNAAASVATGEATAADANIQILSGSDSYRLLNNWTQIASQITTGQLDAGDVLQFDYELTLGTAASNTSYTVRLQNLTDGTDTGIGTVSEVDASVYTALTGSGAYGFFQSINPGAYGSGLSGVQVNSFAAGVMP